MAAMHGATPARPDTGLAALAALAAARGLGVAMSRA
jgi:hypothetical protein